MLEKDQGLMSSDVSLAALSPCSIYDPSSQAAEISSTSRLPSLVSSHMASLITYHLAVPAIDRQTHYLNSCPLLFYLGAPETPVLARKLCL